MIFHRTRDLDPHSLHQLRQLNYFEKISDVNQAISKNQDVVEAIIGHTLRQLVQKNDPEGPNVHEVASISKGLGYVINSDNEIQKVPHDVVPGSQSNQGRINEALAHICRDWHSDYEKERKPLTDFINSRLNHLKGNGRTLIVVPGSGAGCIPYEIAKQFPDFEIHSIEFSTLMYLCNEFVLGHDDQITLMPFAQHYSSQERAEFQLRDLSIDLQKFQKPSNLKVHLGDFRGYNPGSEYDQIVVCSAYFIDTAENLFEYFKSIENLRSSAKSLHWINAGPLKYGTRPLVQLTSDELTKLRQLRNWKDLYSDCDAVHLNGYLTDEHSLYQGYYGLVKFHSVYTGN